MSGMYEDDELSNAKPSWRWRMIIMTILVLFILFIILGVVLILSPN